MPIERRGYRLSDDERAAQKISRKSLVKLQKSGNVGHLNMCHHRVSDGGCGGGSVSSRRSDKKEISRDIDGSGKKSGKHYVFVLVHGAVKPTEISGDGGKDRSDQQKRNQFPSLKIFLSDINPQKRFHGRNSEDTGEKDQKRIIFERGREERSVVGRIVFFNGRNSPSLRENLCGDIDQSGNFRRYRVYAQFRFSESPFYHDFIGGMNQPPGNIIDDERQRIERHLPKEGGRESCMK